MTAATRAPRLPRATMRSGLSAWAERVPWIPQGVGRLATGSGGPSAIIKQLPFVALFALAVAMSLVVPSLFVTGPQVVVASCGVVVLASLLAAAISVRGNLARWVVLVPGLDFLAIGMLRIGTGENASIYGSLVILPVIWFCLNPSRWNVVIAFIGVYVTLGLPLLLKLGEQNTNELWRGFYSAISFALAGLVVNELSSLARRNLEASRARERVSQDEMRRASVVQQALLPKTTLPLPGYQVAGACLPSKAVGGDFFDWYPVHEGLAFTLGDVMGKGVGAGIIAATARAVVRSAKNIPDPVAAIERTADCFTAEMGETASFATMFHARVRADDHTVLFADAGHGLTALVRADGSWLRLESTDLPVGVPGASGWATHAVRLGPGDLIVTFSDGVLDLFDGSLLAVDRVVEMAREAACAEELVERIMGLASTQSNPDDVTVLVLRREA